ncbi:hypothetical protein AC579_2849 [Pseudocercospora musae]|uniref:Uncharacterized protein n=1 Tax=Pseudocercospora musae TaxID=113226 RepID=A0A139I3K8_9PEZI|nr:hypothetical protein AC579_2849 [Pseudocercospora musae]
MQIKNIVATIAALAIGSAIAGPIPVDDSLAVREAVPEVDDSALLARAEQFKNIPSQDQLSQCSSSAAAFASQHVNQAPSAAQLSQARSWWPQYNWQYSTWNYNLWYNYYYYYTYPQYNTYWYSYLNWYW